MKKSALDGAMHDQIVAYQKRMVELTELLPTQPDTSSASDLESAERDKEWSTFVNPDDDAWKKKKVYD